MSQKIINLFQKLKSTGFFYIVISDFLSKSIAFCGGILLVRLLTKNDYGIYSYVNNTLSVLILLGDMGAGVATMQYTQEVYHSPEKRNAFFKFGFRCGLIFCCIPFICVLLSPLIFPFTIKEAIPLTISLCALPFLNTAIRFYQINLRGLLENKKYSILNILTVIINYIILLPMANYFGVTGAIYSNYITAALTLLAAIIISRGLVHFEADTSIIPKIQKKQFVKLSFASQCNNAISQFLIIMDLFFIGLFFKNPETIASYKIASTIPSVLMFLPTSIMIYVLPYFTRNKNNNLWVRSNYKKLVFFNGILCFLVSIVLIILAPFMIPMIFGKEYADVILCFSIIMFGFIFSGGIQVPSENVIYTQRKVKINLAITLTLGLCNAVLDILLIHFFGSVGAAVATASTNILGAFLTFGYMNFFLKNKHN